MNKVEGKENLYKDTVSGAVVNSDLNSYKMAKQYKLSILKEQKEKQELKNRLSEIERIVEQLLQANTGTN